MATDGQSFVSLSTLHNECNDEDGVGEVIWMQQAPVNQMDERRNMQ